MSAFCDVIRRGSIEHLCVSVPVNMAEAVEACSSHSVAGPSNGGDAS